MCADQGHAFAQFHGQILCLSHRRNHHVQHRGARVEADGSPGLANVNVGGIVLSLPPDGKRIIVSWSALAAANWGIHNVSWASSTVVFFQLAASLPHARSMSPDSTSGLIRRASNRDVAAVGELFDRYRQ